jgi:predicted metal-dependent hydrolase
MMYDLPFHVIKGLQAFNQGDFYDAHEHFELAWRETPDDSREFFRALLHFSGGYFRLSEDRPDAALKFFQRSLHWLGNFPSPYYLIDTAALKSHLKLLIAAIHSGQTSSVILKQLSYQIPWPGKETSF